MTDGPSRRRALQLFGTTCGISFLSGCNSTQSSPSSSSVPQFDSRYTTNQPTEAVVTSSITTQTGPPYYATLVTTQKQADELLRIETLPEHAHSEWRSINYGEEFVTVFLSRFDLGGPSGSKPASSVEEDTFVFSLNGMDGEFYYQNHIYTVLERWTLNDADAPQESVVKLNYGE